MVFESSWVHYSDLWHLITWIRDVVYIDEDDQLHDQNIKDHEDTMYVHINHMIYSLCCECMSAKTGKTSLVKLKHVKV